MKGANYGMMAKYGHSVGRGRLALLARPPFQARHALVDKRGVCGPSGFAAVGGFGGCHRTNSWGSGCWHQMQGTFAPFPNMGAIRHEQRCLSSTPVADGAAGGQEERPRKSACKSWSYLAEIVGNQQLAGRGIRTSAGEILKLIDLSASFAASLHCGNPFTTTLAFDHVELTVPILHGDMLHLDSRVAHVGNSSMVVQVVGRKKDLRTRRWVYTVEAFVTFVSLGQDKRPKMVPEIVCDTREEEDLRNFLRSRKELNEKYEKEQLMIQETKEGNLAPGDRFNMDHLEYVKSSDTTITLRKNFLPRALNAAGTIFGGDLLEWMDSAATACASHFTRNPHMITIAMERVFFHKPISVKDVLELRATVVYCRRHTLQVEVEVDVLSPPWEHNEGCDQIRKIHSHRGKFTVLSLSEAGYKQPVGVGLELDDPSDAMTKVRYAKGQHSFNFWMEQRKLGGGGQGGWGAFTKGMFPGGMKHSPWEF